jgi:hypothetical protein
MPFHRPLWQHLSLAQLQRIKQWREAHRQRFVECQLWDAVLTLWMLGWTGWLPAFTLDANWALPLCLLAVLTPQFYVSLRARAHDAERLRCDWIELVR